MLLYFAAVLSAVSLSADDGHVRKNPLYARLQARGIVVDSQPLTRFPEPTITDSLDAAAQQAALSALPKLRVPLKEFLRESINAPFVLSIGDLQDSKTGIRWRSIDLWYVAYGDYRTLVENKKWIQQLMQTQQESHLLTEEELSQRDIHVEPSLSQRVSYLHGASSVLERVRLSATHRMVWSQTDLSLVIATTVDPRFAGDAKYPNQWQSLDVRGGKRKLGPPEPYSVSASYLKATRLEKPNGAILFEYHAIIEQPKKWFGGRQLLKSKLPIMLQANVRTFRRRLQKASRETKP